jgi:hypothetical protein
MSGGPDLAWEMARDTSLWDSPCTGPGWALPGDAAGNVHPLTGEGIAYALWTGTDRLQRDGSPGRWSQGGLRDAIPVGIGRGASFLKMAFGLGRGSPAAR